MHTNLIPINSSTINVGDVVRLVYSPPDDSVFGGDLTVGRSYKVMDVDRTDPRMPIQIKDDAGYYSWVHEQYFKQVI